jgi:hypothetical protein
VEQGKQLRDRDRNQTRAAWLESLRSTGRRARLLEKDQAISYASNRASFRSGEIRILDLTGNVECTSPFNETDRKL